MLKFSTVAEAAWPVDSDVVSMSIIYNLTNYCAPLAKLFNLLETQFLHLFNKDKAESSQGWLQRLDEMKPHKEQALGKHTPCSTPALRQQAAFCVVLAVLNYYVKIQHKNIKIPEQHFRK